ncbi:MAG: glycine--tRNA ligase subunit beta [Rubrimonas sp.]
MPDLLLELFSEEIPARMQARAAADLKKLVTDGLVERGLTYEGAAAYAGPRRLTLDLRGLPKATAPRKEERKGPRADAPSQAIEGFLRATGLSRDQLEERSDRKGATLFAVIDVPGRPAAEVIAEVVTASIRNFPWPKSMRWGTGDLRWVRPLQSILCILSDEAGVEVVPFEVDGIAAGDSTEGHRFMGAGRFGVRSFDDYAARLAAAHVVLDADERMRRIEADARTLAFAQGMEVVEDQGLLAEVAGLVEWPVCIMGDIGDEFLSLPPEVLRTSMKTHQKFFSVRNPATGRIEKFVTVANIETADGGATILRGNRRVLTARLSDARFFWENDLRMGPDQMAAPLADVTFHSKLGSQADRVARIAALAAEIAPMVGADPALAERAGRLCKADLASAMVGEFPELQGVMGRYYALHAGEDPAVAAACAEHYQPVGPSDAAPTAPVSVAVALADKIDMLAGFWAIDEKPTGSKDPFALRRAALGVIRIVLETGARLALRELFAVALVRHDAPASGRPDLVDEDLLSFLHDRLKVHLRDRGVRHDVIAACVTPEADDLAALVARVEALNGFVAAADGANLLAGYRRAVNILTAEERKDGVEYSLEPDPKFAESTAEKALFHSLDHAEAALNRAIRAEDWAAAMTGLAALRAPIDAFFSDVVVNSENAIVRRNRLCLLHRVREVMGRVADFGALEG